LLGGPFGHCEGEKQYAAKAHFAIFGGVPLGLGVSASAFAAGSHGQGWNAERERDVGVSGTEAKIGAQTQMTVDCAQGFN
jgi:hypothetical protein